jgi:predicted dinucleotide-binding enzyme
MTVAVIGSGGIGSAIARQLAPGGESLRIARSNNKSARRCGLVDWSLQRPSQVGMSPK